MVKQGSIVKNINPALPIKDFLQILFGFNITPFGYLLLFAIVDFCINK